MSKYCVVDKNDNVRCYADSKKDAEREAGGLVKSRPEFQPFEVRTVGAQRELVEARQRAERELLESLRMTPAPVNEGSIRDALKAELLAEIRADLAAEAASD